MSSQLSFEQILNEKMGLKNHEDQDSKASQANAIDLNFFEIKINFNPSISSKRKSPYADAPRVKDSVKISQQEKITPPTLPPTVDKITLNAQQLLSLELLNRWGADLNEQNLDNKKLKTAFRKLALKYHPDKFQSGSNQEKQVASEIFQSLKEAFDMISTDHR